MPCDGAISFGDLETKLTVLRVNCTKCPRRGQYVLSRLIRVHGRNAKLVDWLDVIAADCPKKSTRQMFDRCGAQCPDLPRVL